MTDTPIIDQNNASRTKYLIAFKRLPNVVFNATGCRIPQLSVGTAPINTPFATMEFAGDHLEHDDFSMTFNLNETHTNHAEIMNWMYGISFPEEFKQYRDLDAGDDGVYSDFTVTCLTNAGNPKVRYSFTHGFPKSLSGIDLESSDDSDSPIPIQASFGFTTMKHEAV